MPKIRVYLAAMPPTLAAGLKAIVADQPDMEVVGELTEEGVEWLLAAGRTRADIVLLGLTNSELAVYSPSTFTSRCLASPLTSQRLLDMIRLAVSERPFSEQK